MRAHSRLPVKAAGGIRSGAQALELLQAGATRLGCSASAAILAQLRGEGGEVDKKGY